jgi:hypothetical protein
MKTVSRTKMVGGKEVDNLKLHHQMYERRIRLLKECEGLKDNDASDGPNNTAPDTDDSKARRDQ